MPASSLTLKPVALFDIDNTMYDGFSYFELLNRQVGEGLIEGQVLAQARAQMQKYTSGNQSYEQTVVDLLDIYAAGLKDVAYEAALRSAEHFYGSSSKFFAYVEPLLKTLRATHDLAIVTGEPQFVAAAVSRRFGIPLRVSSEYELVGGRFAGKVRHYLASRHDKHDAIQELMHGRDASRSFAFGDSEADIEMLRAVGHAICLNPTDGLRALATKEGWRVVTPTDLPHLIHEMRAA